MNDLQPDKPVKKFFLCVTSDAFAAFTKRFAEKLTLALVEGYSKQLKEDDIVELAVNKLRREGMSDQTKGVEISAETTFIHGNRSMVAFSYYGKQIPRELGDLLFIISIVYQRSKIFERVTINQVKKAGDGSQPAQWDLSNREQLYLLARFPTFERVLASIIPSGRFSFLNFSGVLGSYSLLSHPGDFSFVSASKLDSYLQTNVLKKSAIPELMRYADSSNIEGNAHVWPWIRFIDLYPLSLFGNYHNALNAFDFAQKFLTMNLGEYTCRVVGSANDEVRQFLQQLLTNVKARGIINNDRNTQELADHFFRYPYAGEEDRTDNNGSSPGERTNAEGLDGDLGIIHVTINLGE